MFKVIYSALILSILSFTTTNAQFMDQKELKNDTVRSYKFLEEMYTDDYFPNSLVDKAKQILIDLCYKIENQTPKSLQELYVLTHESTNQFNKLQEQFYEHDSEIETVARDCIASDFEFIAKAYGYEADIEELIATRDW